MSKAIHAILKTKTALPQLTNDNTNDDLSTFARRHGPNV